MAFNRGHILHFMRALVLITWKGHENEHRKPPMIGIYLVQSWSQYRHQEAIVDVVQ